MDDCGGVPLTSPTHEGVLLSKSIPSIPVSILDRANVREGTEADALAATVRRAKRVEQLGYHRFWVAEHHGVPGIAGSAPAVLMAAVAAQTEKIRVGSGGVMLPNHQPLVVAEQAATLQALFPGRIDLGVGRSFGFTPAVRAALRQTADVGDRFKEDLAELLSYLNGTAAITSRPYDDGATPLFVLATGKGTAIAADAGLAVVVGGPVFSGSSLDRARSVLDRYRKQFQPSSYYAEPYVIVSANVAVAKTKEEARALLLPEAWALAQSRTTGEFPSLVSSDSIEQQPMSARQKHLVAASLESSIYGTAGQVADELGFLLEQTEADELIVSTNTFDTEALAQSDAALAGLFGLR